MNNSNISTISGGTLGSCELQYGDVSKFDGAMFIAISALAIIGNVIVFICYARFRVLRTVTNVFMISLSASDLLVAVISIPFSFGVFVCGLSPDYDNKRIYSFIYLTCDMLPSILSIYSLMLVAVDRAIAISKPFSHGKYVTRKTAWISVAVTWNFVAALMGFLFIMTTEQYTLFIILMAYVVPVSIMILSYSIMGYVAKKHASELSELDKTMSRLRAETRNHLLHSESSNNNTMFGNDDSFKPLVVTYKHNLTEPNTRVNKWISKSIRRFSSPNTKIKTAVTGVRIRRRELKAAFTLSLILSCFILSWTPFIALNIEYYRCSTCYIDSRITKYFKLLHYSNSALNPILYVLLNKRWRAAFRKTICFHLKSSYDTEGTNSELFGW